MKKIHLIAILSLFATNITTALASTEPQKDPSDAEIRQKVVGTWFVDLHSSNGVSIAGTVTIVSDSKFISKATMTIGDKKQEVNYEGTWQAKDGFLIETITKSGAKFAPVGKVTRDKIINVDDQELVIQTESGKIETRKRSP
jgi:hypothetical protein